MFAFVLPGAIAVSAESSPPAQVTVAVASNFATPLDELAKAYTAHRTVAINASPGSTGRLAAQIKNGGPFDVFLAADKERVDMLVKDGLADKDSQFTYAIGRLALYAPSAPNVSVALLKSPMLKHLALASPDAAPYGAAAVEVLRQLGLYDSIRDRIAYGENISQTLQFADSGAADAGFVALAQVKAKDPKTYWLVPEKLHSIIRQDACLTATGKKNAAARDFLSFLRSDGARKIIESYGYRTESEHPATK